MADRLTPGATPNPVSVQHDKPSKETVCIIPGKSMIPVKIKTV